MLNKLLPGACLALSLAACATTPSAPLAASASKPPAGCVASTATLVPVSPGTCAGFGNTYTRDDIDHTGATNIGDALRVLDPSLTVRGP